jgi:MinD-like ATPase involved in chromosome partitioning or flagellar assembly
MRPDSQDYLGTAVAVEVAQRLDVAEIRMVVNKLPSHYDPEVVREKVLSSYNAEIGAVLPLSEDLLTLASGGLAVLVYPNHPWSSEVNQLAKDLIQDILH